MRLDPTGKQAKVIVPEDQLSIAIGRGGQNVRLASKLAECEIDIEAEAVAAVAAATTNETDVEGVVQTTELPKQPRLKKKEQLESSLLDAIEEHGE